jgi:DeoR/GlpR family transcriptional regulator of sugar metabolism
LDKHDFITTNEAAKIMSKSPATARRYLAKFKKDGIIIAGGSNKNRTYFPK